MVDTVRHSCSLFIPRIYLLCIGIINIIVLFYYYYCIIIIIIIIIIIPGIIVIISLLLLSLLSLSLSLSLSSLSLLLLSTAVDQAVACAPATQQAWVLSPLGTRFLGEVSRGSSSPVRQMSVSFMPPWFPDHNLAIIIILLISVNV